jgi:hypothetical protein
MRKKFQRIPFITALILLSFIAGVSYAQAEEKQQN